MANTFKLPTDLALLLGQYYIHFYQTVKVKIKTKVVNNEPTIEYAAEFGAVWDKKKDMEAITELADQMGWVFRSCAGTFWFYVKEKPCKVYEVTSETWPLANVINKTKEDLEKENALKDSAIKMEKKDLVAQIEKGEFLPVEEKKS